MAIDIPQVGLGTWELRGKPCTKTVQMALEQGYRHIDTAFAYENHKDIASALKGYPRDQLFITTKLSIGLVGEEFYLSQVDDDDVASSVEAACDLALQELKLDYLDLLLIHWPYRARPLEQILLAMHKLVAKGKLRFPGVSNYTIHHLQDAYDANLSIPFNQVEFHPYCYQQELLAFCQEHQTRLIAARPLGKGKLMGQEPLFQEIAHAHHKSEAQVILRWIVQKGVPLVVKAASPRHLQENLALFDFTLSEEDMALLDQFDLKKRFYGGSWSEFDY